MIPVPYPSDAKANGRPLEFDLEELQQDEAWVLASEIPGAQAAILMLRLVAWAQIPCGSLCADENVLRAMCRISVTDWPRLREVLMRGWWLADDGRLYHDALVHRAQEMLFRRGRETRRNQAWRAGKPQEGRGQRVANAVHERDTDKNEYGLTPQQEIFAQAVAIGKTGVEAYRHAYPKSAKWKEEALRVAGAKMVAIGNVSVRIKALQAVSAEIAGITDEKGGVKLPHDLDPATRAAASISRILAAQVAFAMRRAGLEQVNPSHPKLLALIAAGATLEEFVDAASNAVAGGKDFGYALDIVEGRRKAAAAMVDQIHTKPLPPVLPGQPIERPQNIINVESPHEVG